MVIMFDFQDKRSDKLQVCTVLAGELGEQTAHPLLAGTSHIIASLHS